MIEVKNIRKSFNGKTVIEDVSCVMKAGQCNLIIGSSGSGKTVFMKLYVEGKSVAETAEEMNEAFFPSLFECN